MSEQEYCVTLYQGAILLTDPGINCYLCFRKLEKKNNTWWWESRLQSEMMLSWDLRWKLTKLYNHNTRCALNSFSAMSIRAPNIYDDNINARPQIINLLKSNDTWYDAFNFMEPYLYFIIWNSSEKYFVKVKINQPIKNVAACAPAT